MLLDTQALKVVNSEQSKMTAIATPGSHSSLKGHSAFMSFFEALAQFCALADGHPYIHFTDEEIKA